MPSGANAKSIGSSSSSICDTLVIVSSLETNTPRRLRCGAKRPVLTRIHRPYRKLPGGETTSCTTGAIRAKLPANLPIPGRSNPTELLTAGATVAAGEPTVNVKVPSIDGDPTGGL